MSVKGVDAVYIATDDERIADASADFGAEVIETSPDCRNGTERCAEASGKLDQTPDIVVNLQGDAPLTPAWFVQDLVSAMTADAAIAAATPVLRCDARAYASFRADRAAGRVGATTAVFASSGDALYFSKEVVPYLPAEPVEGDEIPVFHHVGVYAYTPAALDAYLNWAPGPLETNEGLEQLRFLENGHPVRCVQVDARGAGFWELNNPGDVPIIETMLAEQGIE